VRLLRWSHGRIIWSLLKATFTFLTQCEIYYSIMHLSWFHLGELACTDLLFRDYSKRQLVSQINTEIPTITVLTWILFLFNHIDIMMRAPLYIVLLWQTCEHLCMPCPIGLPYLTSSLRWQTCASLCIPRPIGLPYLTSSLRWQTCASLCMPRPIGLPYLTLSLLWQACAPLCMPRPIGLPYLTLSLRWLEFTPFTYSCCWLTPFLILARLWHWACLCCCHNSSCSCNRHDTNPEC